MLHLGSKLQLAIFLLLFFALWAIRATVLIGFDQSIPSPELRGVYGTLVKTLMWVLPAMAFAMWVRRRDPIDYLGISVLPKMKTWAGCLLAIGLFCVLVFSCEMLFGKKDISRENLLATGLAAGIAFHLVSSWVEELFFRGLVLNELSGFMKPVPANLAASLLFVGIHLPYWISSGTRPQEIAVNSFGILVFSLFAGWLYFRSKSVWPPTVAHIANNILSSLLK